MHSPKAKWLGIWAAIAITAHALEVDLVFPRNETYAPADTLPLVFAVQNTHSAELLNLQIWSYTRKGHNLSSINTRLHDLRWVNWSNSSDPYFNHNYLPGLNTSGDWSVTWTLTWQSCNEEALNTDNLAKYYGHNALLEHSYSWTQHFTISDSTPKEVDLVSATANATCPTDLNAIAIVVTDKTMESAPDVNSARRDTCVVIAETTRTLTDPCRVAINEDIAASMAAAKKQWLCNGLNPPDDCPEEKNAAQKSSVFDAFGSLAAFGAVGFALL